MSQTAVVVKQFTVNNKIKDTTWLTAATVSYRSLKRKSITAEANGAAQLNCVHTAGSQLEMWFKFFDGICV